MDMPINIVPAPAGALVALYMKTNSASVHRNSSVHLEVGDSGEDLFYVVRPVVAWGFYRDQDELWLTNHAMVADDNGSLMFAGLEAKHLSQELRTFSDLDANIQGGMPLDAICTPAEVEARIAQIVESDPVVYVCRQTAAQFTGELRLTLLPE